MSNRRGVAAACSNPAEGNDSNQSLDDFPRGLPPRTPCSQKIGNRQAQADQQRRKLFAARRAEEQCLETAFKAVLALSSGRPLEQSSSSQGDTF